jgi:hypothetical protein
MMNQSQQALYDVISISLALMMCVMLFGKAWDSYYPSATKVACAVEVQYQQARVTYIGTGTIYN